MRSLLLKRIYAILTAAALALLLSFPSFAQITQETVLAKIGSLTLAVDAMQGEIMKLHSKIDDLTKENATLRDKCGNLCKAETKP